MTVSVSLLADVNWLKDLTHTFPSPYWFCVPCGLASHADTFTAGQTHLSAFFSYMV